MGEEIDIKDKFLRDKITGLDLKSLAVIGDSNAEGMGWWKEWGKKTDKNDGYCAVLRELFPDAKIDNFSVSGATICRGENYIGSQVDRVIDTGYKYQNIFIQAGFNDISHYTALKTVNFIGTTPQAKDYIISQTDETTMINSLSVAFRKLSSAIPEAKIFFILRESNYGLNTSYQMAYINFVNEVASLCNIMGVTFWNFAEDGLSYNIQSKRNLYYSDPVHWNEKAFRDVITPLIIKGLMGFPISCSSLMNVLEIETFDYTDIFNSNTTPVDNIKLWLKSLPINYAFYGLMYSGNNISWLAEIIRRDALTHCKFTRNNNNQYTIIEYNINTDIAKQKTYINNF